MRRWIGTTAMAALLAAIAFAGIAQAAPAEMGCRTIWNDDVAARCIGDFHDAEAALEAVMRRLLLNSPAQDRAPLRRAERAWAAYRDAQCAYEASGADARDDCRKRLTIARVTELTRRAMR